MSTPQARLPWTTLAPHSYQAMVAVSASSSSASSSLGPLLPELVQTRVSQLNGCAFCLDMHARELRSRGESWQRLNSLSTWRESGLFSPRERAALNWAEALTLLSVQGGPGEAQDRREAAFAALRSEFGEADIVALSWTIAAINAWNRMAVGMQMPVPEKALE